MLGAIAMCRDVATGKGIMTSRCVEASLVDVRRLAEARDKADGLFMFLRMRIPICTTLKSLPQSSIVPKLAPDQFCTVSAGMGTSACQFHHGAKNRSQFQHWAGANMGANI